MKKIRLAYLFFILSPLLLHAQYKENTYYIIQGKVFTETDSSFLNDVHVINMGTERLTATFHFGNFYIPAKLGDQLLFSSIGYRLKELVIVDSVIANKASVEIFMTEQIYMLDQVNVWPYQTYAEFKQAFINMKIEEPIIELNLPKPVIIKETKPGELAPISLGSPITALYMAFSKEGKSIKKYNEIVYKSKYEALINNKYNKEIVKTVTGLTNEDEINDFMKFCGLTDEFILKSIDYDIYLSIKKCYQAYAQANY